MKLSVEKGSQRKNILQSYKFSCKMNKQAIKTGGKLLNVFMDHQTKEQFLQLSGVQIL